jgi:hypothetical protein
MDIDPAAIDEDNSGLQSFIIHDAEFCVWKRSKNSRVTEISLLNFQLGCVQSMIRTNRLEETTNESEEKILLFWMLKMMVFQSSTSIFEARPSPSQILQEDAVGRIRTQDSVRHQRDPSIPDCLFRLASFYFS